MLDVDFADCIDYLADDSNTSALVLYVEAIHRAREFLSAARAFTRRKPLVVYKAGRSEASARAAASHTGAMAGLDSAYDAAFRRAAIVRVDDSRELVNCAEMLARCRLPSGPALAILTNAGGPGVMATDALVGTRTRIAELSAETIDQLNTQLPASWSHHNPADILGDATPERFGQAASILINDPGVDGLLMILTPQAVTQPEVTAKVVVSAVAATPKPALATWMGGESVKSGRDYLRQHEIPTFDAPEDGVRAFSRMAEYAGGLRWLYATPTATPLTLPSSRRGRREQLGKLALAHVGLLDEVSSKAILDIYGIPNSTPRIAHDEDEAVRYACEIGFPVVMKIHSPDISHKSDVGGVKTGLVDAEDVRRTFAEMLAQVGGRLPGARLDGVTVQRQVTRPYGVEIILGSRRDPTFGPVIMVGLGGTTAELLHDCAFELPPLDARLARNMLETLRIWPVLAEYRGRPALAIDGLIDVMLRFSVLIAECPEIEEADLNPLLLSPTEVLALDARFALNASSPHVGRPYAHLAIAPYPEEWIREAHLKSGTNVTLRPIRPEDEPRWHVMLDLASDRTIFARFRSLFRSVVHREATRYCFIDYDREMAFVAEAGIGEQATACRRGSPGGRPVAPASRIRHPDRR